MDTKQEYGEAGKEEKKGDMEQQWYRFHHPRNMHLLDTVPIKCTKTCLLLGVVDKAVRVTVTWVGKPQIVTRPLLHQCRQ